MRSLNGVYIDYPNTAYSSKSCKTFFLVRDTFCFCMRQSQTIVKHGQSHYDHRSLLEVFFQVHTPQFDCMCVNLCHLINFPSAMQEAVNIQLRVPLSEAKFPILCMPLRVSQMKSFQGLQRVSSNPCGRLSAFHRRDAYSRCFVSSTKPNLIIPKLRSGTHLTCRPGCRFISFAPAK